MPRRSSVAGDEVPLERIVGVAEFRAALRRFLRHNEHICRRFGLTPQRYLLLLAIKGAPDRSETLTFTELAERLQLSRNSVTELVGRAEQIGLVERERQLDDQRVVRLRLAPEGERRLLGVLRASEEDRRELRRSLGELERSLRHATVSLR